MRTRITAITTPTPMTITAIPIPRSQGIVFLGRLVVGDDGEEVEIVDAVPCRRCTSADS